jgi:hypothetical protein
MTECNAQAKGMTGDARQQFMISCLSNKPSAETKKLQCVNGKPSGQFLHHQGLGLPQVKKRRRVGKPDAAFE